MISLAVLRNRATNDKFNSRLGTIIKLEGNFN